LAPNLWGPCQPRHWQGVGKRWTESQTLEGWDSEWVSWVSDWDQFSSSKFWACHPLYFLSPKMSVKRKVRPHGFYVNLAQATKKPGEHPVKRHFRSVGMKNKAVAAMVCIACDKYQIMEEERFEHHNHNYRLLEHLDVCEHVQSDGNKCTRRDRKLCSSSY